MSVAEQQQEQEQQQIEQQRTSETNGAPGRAFLPPHIVVLVHGNNGSPTDFDAVEAALLRKFGASQVLIIKSAINHTQTSLGVEVGGTKLAEEVCQRIFEFELHPEVDLYKFSMIAHSLGGLYSRFAIVQLMQSLSPLNINYVSFVTICTPHLGSRRPRGDSKLKNVWRMGVHTVLGSNTIYGQTGIDLLIDCKKTVEAEAQVDTPPMPPLLESMCNPGMQFLSALKQFRFGTLVAMTDGDVVVPYASASIRNFNPYPSNSLTDRFADWRWHLHHSGFASGSDGDGNDERRAVFLKKLEDKVDHTIEIEKFTLGLDVTASPRYQSVDDYDADNKQEVEFSYSMIQSLQQAMPWRRIDITVEPLGVKGKLRLHDWAINKIQPPGCRADEFIDLLCDMIGTDHQMDPLPETASASSSDAGGNAHSADESSSTGDEEPRGSFVGISRMFERFQKRSDSTTRFSDVSQPSPSSTESPGMASNSEEPRNSFIGAGVTRFMERFQRKDSLTVSSPASAAMGAQPSPSPSTSKSEGGEGEPKNAINAGFNGLLKRFQKKETPAPTTTVAAPAGPNTLSASTESATPSNPSSVSSTPQASP